MFLHTEVLELVLSAQHLRRVTEGEREANGLVHPCGAVVQQHLEHRVLDETARPAEEEAVTGVEHEDPLGVGVGVLDAEPT